MASMSPRESIAFRRGAGLPGVEILDAFNTSRNWKWFNTGFGLAVPTTWVGELHYKRQAHAISPGMVFCSEPGEVHTSPRVQRVGTFRAFILDSEILKSYVAEHTGAAYLPRFGVVAHLMSKSLNRRLQALSQAFDSPDLSLELQSRFVDLVEVLVAEIADGARLPRPRAAPATGAAERIRECIHYESGEELDLVALAKKSGLSRFQVLRSFKRRYGLPPHAYQLCVRVALARGLLKEGAAPADIAAQFGFVDQSHFTRHFRQIVGTTPIAYARSHATRRAEQDRVALLSVADRSR